jgi:hypothetical protein|tara:strand:+ start:653 stop:820 length:168 start_codon:yes stop_codon:yes gene_type:complete
MIKSFFQTQFVDLLTDFMYNDLKEKVKSKSNIKKSINTFEDIWVNMLRKSKKNDK